MKNCRTTFIFFSLGLCLSFARLLVGLMATQDILAGTLIPTSVVVMINKITEGFSKAISPSIVKRISHGWSMLLGTLLFTAAELLVVCYDLIELRFAGVVLIGMAYGMLCITVVRIIPCYENSDVLTSAFQSGGNFSSLLASLVYTVLTVWACAAPRTVIAACIPTCLLPYALYWLLDKEPLKSHSIEVKLSKTNDEHYQKVTTMDQCDNDSDNDDNGRDTKKSPFLLKAASKLAFFFKVYPYITYFTLTFYVTTVSVNSVVTTLTFRSSPFRIRDHFLFYVFAFDTGRCLGGLELVIFSSIFPSKKELFKIRRIWILTFLHSSILVFLVYASWYHFVHTVYIVLVLCFVQGILHGCSAVHTLVCASDAFNGVSDKGTAMGMVVLGNSIGRGIGGLLGLFVEHYLRTHCTNNLLMGRFCLARFQSSLGWSQNLEC